MATSNISGRRANIGGSPTPTRITWLPAPFAIKSIKRNCWILPGNKPLKGPVVRKTQNDDSLRKIAPFITVDPLNDKEGKPLEDYLDEVNDEYALALNPYVDDPVAYLAYLPILENKEVVVVPKQRNCLPVVTACEDLFGINRKELMDLRFQMYCMYMTFRHTLNDGNISHHTRIMNERMLEMLVHESSAYAGMVRYFQTKPLGDLPWDFNIVRPAALTRPAAI